MSTSSSEVVSFDTIAWVPTKVTELTRKGVKRPLAAIVDVMEESRRKHVERKLETIVQEEVINMDVEEKKTLEEKVDSLPSVEKLISFTFKHGTGFEFRTDDFVYDTREDAADALLAWLCSHSYLRTKHADDCLLQGAEHGIVRGVMPEAGEKYIDSCECVHNRKWKPFTLKNCLSLIENEEELSFYDGKEMIRLRINVIVKQKRDPIKLVEL